MVNTSVKYCLDLFIQESQYFTENSKWKLIEASRPFFQIPSSFSSLPKKSSHWSLGKESPKMIQDANTSQKLIRFILLVTLDLMKDILLLKDNLLGRGNQRNAAIMLRHVSVITADTQEALI